MRRMLRLGRGGVLAACLLAATLLAGCSQNSEDLDGKNPPPPPSKTGGEMPRQGAGQPSAMSRGLSANDLASPADQGTPPGISGAITIDAALETKVSPNAALFLIARDDSGMPVAVKRIAPPVFPVRFFLGQESVMMEGNSLQGSVNLVARIAQSGSAGTAQPGDLEGTVSSPVKVGSGDVEICIDRVK